MKRKNKVDKKRGFHRKREDFFRSKLVLNSFKSKVAFLFIVLMFGVVIVFAGIDVFDEMNIKKQVVLSSPKAMQNEDIYPNTKITERDNNVFYERTSNNLDIQNPLSEDKKYPEYDGWIVEFKEEPLAVKNKELEGSNVVGANKKSKLEEHKSKIKIQHEDFKNKIKQVSPKTKVKREFDIVFNGLSISNDVTQQELEKLKALSEVKRITPNYIAHTTLMDSVPLINTDDVWRLNNNLQLCNCSLADFDSDNDVDFDVDLSDFAHLQSCLSGPNNPPSSGCEDADLDKDNDVDNDDFSHFQSCLSGPGVPPPVSECLTGKGVTIGIIDTGVDYTHPDLGGCTKDQFLSGNCEKVVSGLDFVNNDNDPMDDNGHGTHVSATAAGKGNVTVGEPFSYLYEMVFVEKYNFENLIVKFEDKYSITNFNYAHDSDDGSGVLPILADSNNNTIHVLEREPAKRNEYIIAGEDREASILKVNRIYNDSSSSFNDDVEFLNIGTGEVYRTNILEEGKGTINVGGKIYHVTYGSATSSDENYVVLTWGIGSSFENWGENRTFAPEIELKNGSRMVIATAGNILEKYEKSCGVNNQSPVIFFINKDQAKICIPPGGTNNELVVGNAKFFGNDSALPMVGGGCGGSYCIFSDQFGNRVKRLNNNSSTIVSLAIGNTGGNVFQAKLYGVAPDAKIVAYKVCGQNGCPYDDVIASIQRSLDPNQDGDFSDHLDVISLSLGADCGNTYDQNCGPDDPLSRTIDNAVDNGVIAVIAAGNCGPGGNLAYCLKLGEKTIESPGTARKAITIGASDKQDLIASFSSRGPVIWQDKNEVQIALIKPDIVAPGVSICAAKAYILGETGGGCLDDQHWAISGTSMATPHVSGVAALIKQEHPDWTPKRIKSVIKESSQPLRNQTEINSQGFGRIDAFNSTLLNDPLIVNLYPLVQDNLRINITGEIIGDDFDHYTISYAPNIPLTELAEESWSIIGSSNILPINNLLYENFDMNRIPFWDFLIRLEVFDTQGRTYRDYGYVKIEKFKLIEPLNKDVVNSKDDLEVSIENLFNLSLDSISLEYTFNQEGPWSSEGVVIDSNSSTAKILGGTFTENGYLNIKITINSLGVTTEKFVIVYVDTALKSGWPVRVPLQTSEFFGETYSCGTNAEFSVGNVYGNLDKEIVFYTASSSPKVSIFDAEGNLLNSWQVEGKLECYSTNYPLLVDVDLDGLNEIIVFNFIIGNYETSRVSAYNYDGSMVWSTLIPVDFNPRIIAADLDNDNASEIIIKGTDAFNNESLTILNSDGAILNTILMDNKIGSNLPSSPSVGNFDNDSELEIVVPFDGKGFDWNRNEWMGNGSIFVYNIDGSIVEGWPVYLPGGPQSPSIGDLNRDGKDEIVVGLLYSSDNFPDTDFGGLWAFDNEGNVLPGWPVEKGYNFWSAPSLFDLNNDGTLEIGASKLGFSTYIFDYEGKILTGWPRLTAWNDYYSSIFGSINNGDFGLVTTAGNNVYGWDVYGNTLQGFPKHTETDAQAPAVLDDLDKDGKIELIASSDLDEDGVKSKHRASIYVWETESNLNDEKQEWPMFHHDKQLTGCYDCDKKQQCASGADTIIADGVINQDELNNYIQEYYIGNVNIDKLSDAIKEHLNGCG